ncbi:MAG: hypothetical protein NPIRA03_16910 [Nitrospirales bacterium]|nr:MAG: hypothetical protein NPIRA03_16910 [Nitrospirales bacterium]
MGKSRKPVVSDGQSENLGTVEMLKTFVNKHQVCWEVLPEQIPVVEDRPLQVGFDLRLYGTHAIEDHPLPGCEKCKAIYKGLRKIATRIIPKKNRASRYEIEIFDSAIRFDRVRSNRPDVTLTIKILHRSDFDQPIDECEVQCLNEMKEGLSLLGAREMQWKSS